MSTTHAARATTPRSSCAPRETWAPSPCLPWRATGTSTPPRARCCSRCPMSASPRLIGPVAHAAYPPLGTTRRRLGRGAERGAGRGLSSAGTALRDPAEHRRAAAASPCSCRRRPAMRSGPATSTTTGVPRVWRSSWHWSVSRPARASPSRAASTGSWAAPPSRRCAGARTSTMSGRLTHAETQRAIAAHSLVINTSPSEGFSNVMLEGWSLARPSRDAGRQSETACWRTTGSGICARRRPARRWPPPWLALASPSPTRARRWRERCRELRREASTRRSGCARPSRGWSDGLTGRAAAALVACARNGIAAAPGDVPGPSATIAGGRGGAAAGDRAGP